MRHGVGAFWAGLAGIVLAATACGGRVASPASPLVPYEGPLWIAPAPGVDSSKDPGAAGRAVDCDVEIVGGTSTTPYTGGEVGDSPEAALQEGFDEGVWDGVDEGLQVAADDDDRVLFVVQTDGRNKQAVIVRHGPAADGTGAGPDGVAWWVESWARCDLAEFPPEVARARNVEVWTDAAGRRVPTTTIVSYPGGDCVPGSTFLELGIPGRDRSSAGSTAVYVARAGEEYATFFAEPYRQDVDLPADAVDTEYDLRGRHLWLSTDRQRAYVGDRAGVELWPRTVQQLACG